MSPLQKLALKRIAECLNGIEFSQTGYSFYVGERAFTPEAAKEEDKKSSQQYLKSYELKHEAADWLKALQSEP